VSAPATEPDRVTAVGLLFEAAAGLRRTLAPATEEQLGVAGQAFEILIRLYRSPGHALRMSDLAAQTGLTPSGLTRAVDRIEVAGLVEREACEEDRRGAFARLTALGIERTDAAIAQHREEVDALFGALFTTKEEETLVDLLRRIRDQVHPDAAHLSDDLSCIDALEVKRTRSAR